VACSSGSAACFLVTPAVPCTIRGRRYRQEDDDLQDAGGDCAEVATDPSGHVRLINQHATV
jgi:hypothetical protein